MNNTYTIGWKAPLNRLVLATGATWLSTKERPGFEIDARAQRKEPTYSGSVEIRGFAKTFIGVRGSWTQVNFDETAEFEGINLQEQLDRTTTSAAVTLRHQLTPLTSITFSVGRSEERFKFATSRDSNLTTFAVGLSFDPAALIKGSARVGYSSYKPMSADLPGYDGSTADVSLELHAAWFHEVFRGRETRHRVLVRHRPAVLRAHRRNRLDRPTDLRTVRRGRSSRRAASRSTRPGLAPPCLPRIEPIASGVTASAWASTWAGICALVSTSTRNGARRYSSDRQYEGLKYGTSITYGTP